MPATVPSVSMATPGLVTGPAARQALLAALEQILKFDDDPSMRRAARKRYLELTDGREPTT